MPYLIDGHNVIAALPDIDLADDNDEAQLVIKLRTWTSRIRRKAIVIFDGGITGGPSTDLSSPDVQVVFAARFHTNADRIIRERLLSLHDAPNWTVISSDHEILDEARQAGARSMTAQKFSECLSQPVKPEQEKPDYVSPAAVNAWLELFPEPESTNKNTPQKPTSIPQKPTEILASNKQPRIPKIRDIKPPVRSMRSIGEQLGRKITPQAKSKEKTSYSEKPAEISSQEVDAWLEIFHDPAESHVPKPKRAKKRRKQKQPQKPVVRKSGELTQDEVVAWLHVFPETDIKSEPTKSPATAKRRHRRRKLDKKLAQHKAKHVTGKDETASSLSEDDLELWQRMFGS
jgi:predicted RNA-binding protein with PIN domain